MSSVGVFRPLPHWERPPNRKRWVPGIAAAPPPDADPLFVNSDSTRRYNLAATHANRGIVPQQRALVSDPNLLIPPVVPDVPFVPQRTIFTRDYGEVQWIQQRRFDPSLLAAPAASDPTLGESDNSRRRSLVAALYQDRRQTTTQQIKYATFDTETIVGTGALGAWWGLEDVTSHLANVRRFTDPTLLTPAVTINQTSIKTGEQFGNPTVTTGAVTISPVGIPSSETTGNVVISVGASLLNPIGISTTETFGSQNINLGLNPTGVKTDEKFGTVTTTLTISPSGIPSVESFGNVTTTVVTAINGIGIPTGETFGNITVTPGAVTLSPTCITTVENFGTPIVSVGPSFVNPIGISTNEQLGTPSLTIVLSPTGIKSDEYLGVVSTTITVSPYGVPTFGNLGNPTLSVVVGINPFSIQTSELFGAVSVTPGAVTLSPIGITSGQQLGITNTSFNILPSGIITTEKFGNLGTTFVLLPVGVKSSETVGTANVSTGIQNISAYGIRSVTSFGLIVVQKILSPQDADMIVFFRPEGIVVTIDAPGTILLDDGIL